MCFKNDSFNTTRVVVGFRSHSERRNFIKVVAKKKEILCKNFKETSSILYEKSNLNRYSTQMGLMKTRPAAMNTGPKPDTSRPKPPTKGSSHTRRRPRPRAPPVAPSPRPAGGDDGRIPEGSAWARLCAAPRVTRGPLSPRPRPRRGPLPRPRPRRGRPLAARHRTGSTRHPMAVSPGSAPR